MWLIFLAEAPEEEYDHRSLFDRLQEQKQRKEFEFEEAHRLSKNFLKRENGFFIVIYIYLLSCMFMLMFGD